MANDFTQVAKEFMKAKDELDTTSSSLDHARRCLESAEARFTKAKAAAYDEKWLDANTPMRTVLVGENVVTLSRNGKGVLLYVSKAEISTR